MPDQQQQQQKQQQKSQYQQRIVKQKPKQHPIQHQHVEHGAALFLEEYQQRQELNQRLQHQQPQQQQQSYQQLREKIPQRPHAENHIFITNVNQNCLTASSLVVNKQNQKTISATADSTDDCCPAIPILPITTATTATGPTTTATTSALIPAQSTVCQPKCKQTTAGVKTTTVARAVESLLVMCRHQQQYQHQHHRHHQNQHQQQQQQQNQQQQHSQYQTENLNLKQYPQQRPQKQSLVEHQQKPHHQQQHQHQEKQQHQKQRYQHCQDYHLPSLYSNRNSSNSSSKSKNLRKSLYSTMMEQLLVIGSLLIALSVRVAGDESQDFQKNSKFCTFAITLRDALVVSNTNYIGFLVNHK
uniref:Uncharacterized protein n=1 Tax=Musca domestica TaxID=7370 RepID=A0A1I8NJF6_MUSDO